MPHEVVLVAHRWTADPDESIGRLDATSDHISHLQQIWLLGSVRRTSDRSKIKVGIRYVRQDM